MQVSEYLTAYGVTKKKSGRGKSEFTSGGREAALDGLKCLAEKPRLHAYDRRVFENGRVTNVRVEAVAPLINLQQVNGELTITPCPVMVDQIETFFVWKPADLYSQVLDGKDRTKALFIEYLLHLYEMNRRGGETAVYVVKRQMEAVAYALQMDALLDARQEKQVRARLNQLYAFAKQINYLKDHEVDVPGAKYAKIDRLQLERRTFQQMRKAYLQVLQTLPANLAESASNCSTAVEMGEGRSTYKVKIIPFKHSSVLLHPSLRAFFGRDFLFYRTLGLNISPEAHNLLTSNPFIHPRRVAANK